MEKQLKPVIDFQEIEPGDVFFKGGFPGHAMLFVDGAQNKEGKKIFMLAQSYMPAQDIHIVKNPLNEKVSPGMKCQSQIKLLRRSGCSSIVI